MATLDVKSLSVGDVFYGAKDTNNGFLRKKIYREIDGVQWFRYDMPLASYSLVTYTVLGLLDKTLSGIWERNSGYDLSIEIYLSYEVDGVKSEYTMYAEDLDSKELFLDRDEALAHMENIYTKNQDLDRGVESSVEGNSR
jgi:hypothetical protein